MRDHDGDRGAGDRTRWGVRGGGGGRGWRLRSGCGAVLLQAKGRLHGWREKIGEKEDAGDHAFAAIHVCGAARAAGWRVWPYNV